MATACALHPFSTKDTKDNLYLPPFQTVPIGSWFLTSYISWRQLIFATINICAFKIIMVNRFSNSTPVCQEMASMFSRLVSIESVEPVERVEPTHITADAADCHVEARRHNHRYISKSQHLIYWNYQIQHYNSNEHKYWSTRKGKVICELAWINTTPWGYMGKWRYSSTILNLWARLR